MYGQVTSTSSGQVMLITVFALSGTILGATTIAGLLMLYQIRQSTDITNSTKAIFAADAGLEEQLYKLIGGDVIVCDPLPNSTDPPSGKFNNGAEYRAGCDRDGSVYTIRSQGISNNISRAFQADLDLGP